MRPAALVAAGNHGTSRFPHAVRPRMHGVSDRAGSRCALRWRRIGCGLPPSYTASAPRTEMDFAAQYPACALPCQRFASQGYPYRRKRPVSGQPSGPIGQVSLAKRNESSYNCWLGMNRTS
jgi:hypothetical protein